MMSGDYAVPPPAILKQGLSTKKDQFQISPSGGNRYISLNTHGQAVRQRSTSARPWRR